MQVTASDILEELRGLHFPRETRRSVRRDDNDEKRGFMLGHVVVYNRGWAPSRCTRKYAKFAQLLCAFARQQRPDFPFTSIMVNEGGSALHVDSMNCGRSLIIALGDHVGGDLWQYPGKVLEIRDRLMECNGCLPHITMPFEGERYSLVFFNIAGNRPPCTLVDKIFLRRLGFYRLSERDTCEYGARKDLLHDAARILRRNYGLAMKYIGDYENKTIKPPFSRRRGSVACCLTGD